MKNTTSGSGLYCGNGEVKVYRLPTSTLKLHFETHFETIRDQPLPGHLMTRLSMKKICTFDTKNKNEKEITVGTS